MQTKKQKFIRGFGGIAVIGQFKNEYGEEFLLYRFSKSPHVFITGDELDWDFGWRWNPADKNIVHDFFVNDKEMFEIEKIIQSQNPA